MDYKKHLTKGKWDVYSRGNELSVKVNGSLENICAVQNKATIKATEANAQLIIEAGTVCNECGKTPRELLEERDMLADKLLDAKIQLEYLHEKFPRTGTTASVINQIEITLKKISG